MTTAIPKESEEQIQFVEYCKNRGIRAISTQNGMYVQKGNFNHFGYINRQKKMGLAKGFPDLIVFARNSKHECLFLEMKRQAGGKLSPEQSDWIGFLDNGGYCVGIAKGCDEAIRLLEKYLKI